VYNKLNNDMINILKILFGRGWYALLYLISYFWYFVFPGILVVGLMKEFWQIAKEGDDLGLALVIPLSTPVVLTPVLMVGSILWVKTLGYVFWKKFLIVIGVSVIVPIIIAVIGMGMSNKMEYFLYYGGYFAMFALHLFMLHKFISNK